MSYPGFEDAMRRIITGDDASGKSVVIVDGPPSSIAGAPGTGGLFEIWHDVLAGALNPKDTTDLGPNPPVLSPDKGKVKVRWFIIEPLPEGVPKAALNDAVKSAFATIGGDHHMIDQSRHPGMHETDTLDVICLIKGEVSLILEGVETRLKPGNIVVQRGTNHAWEAHGGPALLLAVLIDRNVAH